MLRETFINDNNRQVSVWQYEEISAYNEKMNTNYDYSEHEEKGWNKEDTVKCIKDSLIGLAAITLLTMLVAFLRFAFVAKVDSKYLWAYTVEYPKLVFKWIVVLWILWIIIHLIYKAVTHKKVYFEYFKVEHMKALQKRNKKNRTADYEGLTEDRTSERYQDIKVIGYIELGRGFKENKDTDILEIPTGRQDDDGEEIIQKFNMFTGKAAGKIVGYIKVDEDKYVGIIEHHLYPFVISGIATATIICTVVTSDIRPVEVNTATGDVEISDTMDKLQRDIQEIEKAETLYLWVPAFSSELKLDADNPYVPLRNFSENQFRDEMWTEADKLREEVAENPDKHDKEEMRKKFSITYLTLTATEINNCIDYVYGLTDEKLRETYENEFSFQYDILVDKETAKKMHISDIDSSIVEKYRNSEEVVVYSTYPELLPPGTQYDWNAFWAFTEPGRYKVTLKVIPYLTETLEAGSPRNVTVDIVISK